MAKIKQLPSGSYNTLIYDYTDNNGKRKYKSITAPTKREVKQLVAEFLAEKDNAKSATPEITVGEAIDRYISSKENLLSPSTVAGYKSIRRTRLLTIINTRLENIDIQTIQKAINNEAKEHSPKTVRNINALLRSSLEFAIPGFKYTVTLPQKIKPDIQIPTEAEMMKIFKEIKNTPLEVSIYLAALCGMRRSEIAALRWEDVDLEAERLTIKAASVRDTNGQYIRKTTKTTAGKRTIRIFSPVLKLLKEQTADTEYVVTMPTNSITSLFPKLLEKLGLPHYRFHDLRHYAVSTMLLLNLPKKYIADYVGHETEHMIDTVYGHVMQDKKDSLLDTVNTHFCGIFAQMQDKMQDEH